MKHLRDRKILCIDGATKITGWAIFDLDKVKLLDYGEIKVSSTKYPVIRDRVKLMIDGISEILDNNDIDEIVMEEVPPSSRNTMTVLSLGILSGAVLQLTHSRDIPIHYITVPRWHSELGIKPSLGDVKEQSIKWANNKFNLKLKYVKKKSTKNEDNKSDPIAFGYVYLTKLKGKYKITK